MNIPDYWIKTIKELKDEDWKPSSMFWETTNRRQDEKTISYAESHDQALVGDKTIIFRLIDADMYWHFKKGDENFMANRGIALHKMIRLLTASTSGSTSRVRVMDGATSTLVVSGALLTIKIFATTIWATSTRRCSRSSRP